MPNIKSAKRRMKTSAKARLKNRSERTRIRTAIKNVRQAGSADAGQTTLRAAVSVLDRAATKRLLHPKTVARIKSGLTRHVSSLGA
jgi:small subunit ribosomal protein S20